MKEIDSDLVKLVTRLKHGSKIAFDELFRKFGNRIYRLSIKLNLEHQEAQEVVQEVFLAIWERREFLDPEKDFKAYIFKIAKNLIIRSFRRKALGFAYENYVKQDDQMLDYGTEEMIDYRNLLELLEEEIRKLPSGRKEIFILSRRDNLTNEEIAAKLGVSRRTVENQIYRTLRLLKEKIQSFELMLILLPLFF